MRDVVEASARIHSALGDPTRVEICWLLAEKERSVTELVGELKISQPLASHHLRVLKEAGLVSSKRDSYWTRYRLLPQRIALLKEEAEMLVDSASSHQGHRGGPGRKTHRSQAKESPRARADRR